MANGNGHLEHIHERSQKLTEALYRVTDLFSDSEPLKWLLRREGLNIFETLLAVKTAPTNERVKGLSQTAEKIRQLVKVFELAASGSFISDANFQVLKREYVSLADYLSEKKTHILPEPPAEALIGQPPIGQIGQLSNGHKEQNSNSNGNPIKEEIAAKPDIQAKDKVVRAEHPAVSAEQPTETTEKSVANGERRGEIVSLIKNKDWVSVGELAETFKGRISEKTLQRDLVGMADEGLLLREGEKRWRRYKLAG